MKTRIAKKIVYNTNKLRMWNVFGYGKKPKLKYLKSQRFRAVLKVFGDSNIAKLYAIGLPKKIQIKKWTQKKLIGQ